MSDWAPHQMLFGGGTDLNSPAAPGALVGSQSTAAPGVARPPLTCCEKSITFPVGRRALWMPTTGATNGVVQRPSVAGFATWASCLPRATALRAARRWAGERFSHRARSRRA
jgi:hypothetical protein